MLKSDYKSVIDLCIHSTLTHEKFCASSFVLILVTKLSTTETNFDC